MARPIFPQYIIKWKDEIKGMSFLAHKSRAAWDIRYAHDVVLGTLALKDKLPATIKRFDDDHNSALWTRVYAKYLSLLINTCYTEGTDVLLENGVLSKRPFVLRKNNVRVVTPVASSKDLESLHTSLYSHYKEHLFGVYLLGKTDLAGAKRIGADQFYPDGWSSVPWYAQVDLDIKYEWFRVVPQSTRSVPANARLLTDPRAASPTRTDTVMSPPFKCLKCAQEDMGFYHDNLDTFTCMNCGRRYHAEGMEQEGHHGVKLIHAPRPTS